MSRSSNERSGLSRRSSEEEKRSMGEKGDHFAPGGANDRSFQKHAIRDPEGFVGYYGLVSHNSASLVQADVFRALVCEACLGPGYQVTAQANVVKPDAKAQNPHRDYRKHSYR